MSKSLGGFYVNKRDTLKNGWRLIHRSQVDGKTVYKTVKGNALIALGFSLDMTVEQATALASQLNAQSDVKRQESRTITFANLRLERDALYHSAFVPKDLNDAFVEWLRGNTSPEGNEVSKALIQWGTAKKIIIALGLSPEKYEDNKRKIFIYLAAKEYSLSYSEKLIGVINKYGRFVSKLRGTYFHPVPPPKSADRERIVDAYRLSDGYIGPSDPLTPDILKSIESKISPAHYKWLFCSVWFGLRPSEVDAINEDRSQKVWGVIEDQVNVLKVYQPKLSGVPFEDRWKFIPILYPEQKAALALMLEGKMKRPLSKTIKLHTEGACGLYGGRKNFVDMMLAKGQELVDIADWMGHRTTKMTLTYYKSRRIVHWAGKKASG